MRIFGSFMTGNDPLASESDDTFVWTRAETNPVVNGGGGFDTWDLTAYAASSFFYTQPVTIRLNAQGGIDLVASMYVRGGGFYEAVIGQGTSIERLLLGTGFSVDLAGAQTGLVIVGNSDGETIATGSGDDTINSGGGDDLIRPGAGNNTIDGGAGEDVVHLNYAYSASSMSIQGGALQVVSGGTARNILIGIERIVFTDRTVDLTRTGAIIPDTVRIENGLGFGADNLVGQASADSLFGHAGSDVLDGAAGNDWLFGGSGTDRLVGGAGDDYLDGGDGADAALYTGLRRQYAVGETTVSGGPAGTGADTLVSIEELRFADGVLVRDVGDSNTLRALRLFDAALGRPADSAGLSNLVGQLDQGLTVSHLAGTLFYSAEGQAIFRGLSDQQFVALLYRNALNREADPAGLSFWTGQLSSMQRSEVIAIFAESAEHRAIMGEPASGPMWVADAEALFIARLYDAALGRAPDAAGLTQWIGLLDGGMNHVQVIDAFIGSPEFALRFGALDNRHFVELLYRTCLDRDGDTAGVNYWTGQLDNGVARSSLVFSFSESPEHIALTAPLWAGGIRFDGSSATPVETVPDKGMDVALVLPGPAVHDEAFLSLDTDHTALSGVQADQDVHSFGAAPVAHIITPIDLVTEDAAPVPQRDFLDLAWA